MPAFPETWFVGRDGRLVGEHIKGAFSEEQLEAEHRARAWRRRHEAGASVASSFARLPSPLAAPAWASEEKPTLAELERELTCPTCDGPLALSNAPVADRIRAFIRERIAAGDTKSEIKEKLVESFGETRARGAAAQGLQLACLGAAARRRRPSP